MKARSLIVAFFLTISLCVSSVAHASGISIHDTGSDVSPGFSSEFEGDGEMIAPVPILLPGRIDRPLGVVQEGEYQGLRYKVVEEPVVPVRTSGTAQPNMKVGAGKFIYLYVDTAEFNGLSTAGGYAYTGVVCGMLATVTGIGGLACGAITQGIFAYVRTKSAPKSNQCGEIKLAWVGFGPVGYKVINKPCNKI